MRVNRQWMLLAGLTLPALVLGGSASSASPLSLGYFFQVALSLGFVLLLVVGAVWAMKRLSVGMPGTRSPLKLIGGTLLGGKERVVVVELGDKWLVLGVTPQSVNLLTELPRPAVDEQLPSQDAPAKFQQWLQLALKRKLPNDQVKP